MGSKGIRIKDIEHLKQVLKKSKLNIDGAYLFGSRAKGEYLEGSDWDLMVVSDDFEGISFPERATFFIKYIPLRRTDIFCYTKKEFKKKAKEIGIVSEALKGVKLL